MFPTKPLRRDEASIMQRKVMQLRCLYPLSADARRLRTIPFGNCITKAAQDDLCIPHGTSIISDSFRTFFDRSTLRKRTCMLRCSQPV